MAYNNLSHVNGTTNIYVTSSGGSTPDTQNLNIGGTIGYAKINQTATFQESSSPTLYNYVAHNMNGGTGTYGGTVSIPQYLDGWFYLNGATHVNFTGEGSEFSSSMVPLFDASTHNLDLYATWGDTRVVRVILFEPEDNFLISNPYGEITLTSTGSYSASGGDAARNLPSPFKEIIDYNGNFGFDYNGNLEYGVGDGCPKTISGNTVKNSYFAVKNGTSFTFSLEDVLAKNYSNNTTHEWYKLPEDKTTGDTVIFYQESLTNQWPGGSTPSTSGWNTKVVTLSSGQYTCTFTNVTTDITIYIPYLPTESIRINASTDPNNVGSVTITPTETNGAGPGNSVYAYAMPGDSVTLTASAATGYAFEGWYLNGGQVAVSSSMTYTFTVPALSYGTQSYVAKYTATNYTITYHKTVPES